MPRLRVSATASARKLLTVLANELPQHLEASDYVDAEHGREVLRPALHEIGALCAHVERRCLQAVGQQDALPRARLQEAMQERQGPNETRRSDAPHIFARRKCSVFEEESGVKKKRTKNGQETDKRD